MLFRGCLRKEAASFLWWRVNGALGHLLMMLQQWFQVCFLGMCILSLLIIVVSLSCTCITFLSDRHERPPFLV